MREAARSRSAAGAGTLLRARRRRRTAGSRAGGGGAHPILRQEGTTRRKEGRGRGDLGRERENLRACERCDERCVYSPTWKKGESESQRRKRRKNAGVGYGRHCVPPLSRPPLLKVLLSPTRSAYALRCCVSCVVATQFIQQFLLNSLSLSRSLGMTMSCCGDLAPHVMLRRPRAASPPQSSRSVVV